MTISQIESLIERVSAATGPDRELDARVEVASGLAAARDGKGRAKYPDGRRDRVPPYTASLDAALALVERVLPGAAWEVSHAGYGAKQAWGSVWPLDMGAHGVHAATPALAVCLALLRSLAEKEGE